MKALQILFSLLLICTIQAGEPKFRQQEIDKEVGIGYGLQLADMNGDGFADIVTGEWSNYGEDRVVFNNGDGTFNFRKADDTLVK